MMKILAKNKKAYFDYEILEKFEAGIVLTGNEVKSIRAGRMSLVSSFVILKNEEVFLINASIPPYQPKNVPAEYEPIKTRKLLLKKSEIKHLIGKSKQKGLTLIPLKVYTDKRNIKIEFAVGRGKKKFDKREKIKKQDIEREMRKALKYKF
ncbi:MAG: SsrA-binding protein SmpB [Patescibacteria group bacterium]|nr:SsrA-binding protein SmpB [Patescibacteria group bacterium]